MNVARNVDEILKDFKFSKHQFSLLTETFFRYATYIYTPKHQKLYQTLFLPYNPLCSIPLLLLHIFPPSGCGSWTTTNSVVTLWFCRILLTALGNYRLTNHSRRRTYRPLILIHFVRIPPCLARSPTRVRRHRPRANWPPRAPRNRERSAAETPSR